jgi:hypothetical protein
MKLILPDPELFWEYECALNGNHWWTLGTKDIFYANHYVATVCNTPDNKNDFYWQGYTQDGLYIDTGVCCNLDDAKKAVIAALIRENIITM